ncbi:hypothetical protein SEA_VIEENROSE_71 [Streptomyces phage VieEnRose]|nr:hypothetical protein SEA_VIEENROSE_71 [Streptomyces phage VieEnRose]
MIEEMQVSTSELKPGDLIVDGSDASGWTVSRQTFRYLAVINIPGYCPMDDDPPKFENAWEAWEYLADERERDEDSAEYPPESPMAYEYSQTVVELRVLALDESSEPGTVYGETPGHEDSDHDLGLAYTVMEVLD